MASYSAEIIQRIQKKAQELRKDIISMIARAGSGHPGGSLSAIDIIACLYYQHMQIRPQEPGWDHRDRFVLSKGHCCPALYSVLADLGYFPRHELKHLRKVGSKLQGHPDMHKTPGVDMTTGSLGQGLSVGLGMALGATVQARKFGVYVMLGCGEINEGQVWEAAMAAAHFKADNLTAILDYNGLQIDGTNDEVMSLGDVAGKWKAFGWNVLEIDGHNIPAILSALEAAGNTSGRPSILIAKTIKGKGVSFMEDRFDWHGQRITEEQESLALRELQQEV
ncbi:MAG: transketolase [Actinobacteria bacterium]|nr:transketolase [Actinomycetota bacterium]